MKKLTVFAAIAVMMLGFAGTANAQHHGGNHGNFHGDYRGNFHGDYRGYNGYRGGWDNGWHRGGVVIGGGGIDIIIGGRRGYPYPYPNGGWDGPYNYPAPTRIIYERVYDSYNGGYYNVSHVARWDNYYRGYVWYDVNGNLRVN